MRIEWLVPAILDLQRLREFLQQHNPQAAQRVVKIITAAVAPLVVNPRIGKPVEDLPDYYDIYLPFGASGYVLRYRIAGDTLFIIALKHCREAGFAGHPPEPGAINDGPAAYGKTG